MKWIGLLASLLLIASVAQADNIYGKPEINAIIDHATSGNNTIVAAVTGKSICVLAYTLVTADAVTVRFESGAGGTALTGQMSFAANGGVSVAHAPDCHFATAKGALLNLELGSAVSVDGHLKYVVID